jgi:hypothetical protein
METNTLVVVNGWFEFHECLMFHFTSILPSPYQFDKHPTSILNNALENIRSDTREAMFKLHLGFA